MVDLLSDADATRIADILWQYRKQLERMEFLLETQLLLASAGKDQLLHHVADFLGETADSLAYIDLQREVLLSDRGVPADMSSLIAAVDAPWDELFEDHRQWFANSISRIQDLSGRNKRTIEQSQATLKDLSRLIDNNNEPSSSAYDESGNRVAATRSGAMLFDGQV